MGAPRQETRIWPAAHVGVFCLSHSKRIHFLLFFSLSLFLHVFFFLCSSLCFCVCAVQLLTLFHLYEQCHHRFSPWCCCCCKQRRDRISLRSGSQAPSVNVSPLQRDWWVESVSFLESRRQLANNNLVAMIPSPITLARNGTGRLNQKIHTHITRESNRPQVWTTISPRSVLMNCLVNCPPLQKNKKNTETHVGSYSIHDFWASLFLLSNGLPSQ